MSDEKIILEANWGSRLFKIPWKKYCVVEIGYKLDDLEIALLFCFTTDLR